MKYILNLMKILKYNIINKKEYKKINVYKYKNLFFKKTLS